MVPLNPSIGTIHGSDLDFEFSGPCTDPLLIPPNWNLKDPYSSSSSTTLENVSRNVTPGPSRYVNGSHTQLIQSQLTHPAFNHDQSNDAEAEYDRLRDLARQEASKRGECFSRVRSIPIPPLFRQSTTHTT